MSYPPLKGLPRFLRESMQMGRALGPRSRHRLMPLFLAALVFIGAYLFAFHAPPAFTPGTVVRIEQGTTVGHIAQQLAREEVIRHPAIFSALMRLLGGERSAVAGAYYFENPEPVFVVAWRVARGVFGVDPIRVVVPEGTSARGIARILSDRIAGFDSDQFYERAKHREGYLYPDTYFILPTASPRSVAELMAENFRQQIGKIRQDIYASGYSLEELVIMASLLEKEARDFEVRRRIAGVLWNRIERDMPLQVDAVFLYINGKSTFDLTKADLATDSLYNTYRYKGLPPGPITNPSLESIKAAASPISSDFLYYLADRNGTTYFSSTFEEHKEKKRRYLN